MSTTYGGLPKQTSFPPYGIRTQASPIWNLYRRYKYNIIQSANRKSEFFIYLLFLVFCAFYQECSFPDVCMCYSLIMFKCLCSKFSSFKGGLTTKLKNNASNLSILSLNIFIIALSLPEILYYKYTCILLIVIPSYLKV